MQTIKLNHDAYEPQLLIPTYIKYLPPKVLILLTL